MVVCYSQGLALALTVKTRHALAAAARKVRDKNRKELVRMKQACQPRRRDNRLVGAKNQSSGVVCRETLDKSF